MKLKLAWFFLAVLLTPAKLQLDILAPEPARLLLGQVWISNDSRRLPLYLVTRTRFGEIRFQLNNAANTR